MNGLGYKYCNINRCSTVICLPCHLPAFERDATSEPMAPGSILNHLILLHNCYLLPFVTCYYLSLSLAFYLVTSETRGLTTLLPCWGQVLCVFGAQVLLTCVAWKLLLVR